MESSKELLKFYKGKKVLVTGSTGFKGSWLSAILYMAGADVVGYALKPVTQQSLFDQLCLGDKIKQYYEDIRDYDTMRRVFDEEKPEIVLHLAAQPIVRESYVAPRYTFDTNVMGTVNVLECVRLTDSVSSFLNVTTDKVYENKEQEKGYVETDYLDGYDPYSNSKSCSELVTHSYKKSFFADSRCRISTARAGNVIGGGDYAKDRIIPDCIRAAVKNEVVNIRNPYSIRPYQHVLEPLAIYLMIAKKQAEDSKYEGYYNVGPDEPDCVTTGKLVDIFASKWGDGFSWNDQSDGGPHEAGFLKLDCTKLKTTFGWQPKYNIDQAVEKTVEWQKKYTALNDAFAITKKQIIEFFEV